MFRSRSHQVAILLSLSCILVESRLEYWYEKITYQNDEHLEFFKTSCMINNTRMSSDHFDGPFDVEQINFVFITNTTNTSIPVNLNAKYPDLKILRVESTDLSKVTKNQTQYLTRIEILYLGNNNIRTVDKDAFQNTLNVKLLHLNNNKVSNFHDETFQKLVNLKKLFLQDNQLTILQAHLFSHNSRLEVLNLQNNKLLIIFPLPHLKTLSLANNICINKHQYEAIKVLKHYAEEFCQSSVENLRQNSIYLSKILNEFVIRHQILRHNFEQKRSKIESLEDEIKKLTASDESSKNSTEEYDENES